MASGENTLLKTAMELVNRAILNTDILGTEDYVRAISAIDTSNYSDETRQELKNALALLNIWHEEDKIRKEEDRLLQKELQELILTHNTVNLTQG